MGGGRQRGGPSCGASTSGASPFTPDGVLFAVIRQRGQGSVRALPGGPDQARPLCNSPPLPRRTGMSPPRGTPSEDRTGRRRRPTDWASVYRAVYPEVLRYLRFKLRDEAQAEDLAQEAFARVLGRQADNPRGLVFTAAANLARDAARTVTRRKRHLALLKVEADVRAEEGPDPQARLEAEERTRRLERALDELGERDREVLLLWNAGLDYRHIAAETGLALGAIGTTVARAKKRLVSAHAALQKQERDDAAHG